MKLCNNCQRELQDHQQVCPYCGETQDVVVRYRRTPAPREEEPIYEDVVPERARALAGGVGTAVSGYFGYIRDKWSGKNVRETSPVLSLLTMMLYSLFTGLLANIAARGNFMSFMSNFFIILSFVILSGLLTFVIAKLLGHDRDNVLDFLFDFGNYLILPMLLSLIGVVIGLLKAHNVAQIMLFISLFFVFTAMASKLTKSRELNQPNHYPSLLIASLLFAGFILFLTRLLF